MDPQRDLVTTVVLLFAVAKVEAPALAGTAPGFADSIFSLHLGKRCEHGQE